MSTPIPYYPVAKVATPIASFAPIQKTEAPKKETISGELKPGTHAEDKSKPKPSAENRPTVTIPPKAEGTIEKQLTTPTVSPPTPQQTPASVSTRSSEGLIAAHEIPDTPPADTQQTPKK